MPTASGFFVSTHGDALTIGVMAPEWFTVVAFLAAGGGLVLIVGLAARHSERVVRNAEALAKRLGLVPALATKRMGFWLEPRASGQLRGRPARLFTYTTGSGKSRVRWTALAVHPAATGGLAFQMTRQGFGSKFSELFGAKEITVGDRAFDDAWFLRTNQPEFFRAALIPELRTSIASAFDASGRAYRASIKLEKDMVVYAEAGDFADERRCERMAQMADVLADLAAVAEVFARLQADGDRRTS